MTRDDRARDIELTVLAAWAAATRAAAGRAVEPTVAGVAGVAAWAGVGCSMATAVATAAALGARWARAGGWSTRNWNGAEGGAGLGLGAGVKYLALSAPESAAHSWPRATSRFAFRRSGGRSGRCSRQKAL
eukprot:scaffold81342_cov61-Phaeocystis_antarctica.AAC.3